VVVHGVRVGNKISKSSYEKLTKCLSLSHSQESTFKANAGAIKVVIIGAGGTGKSCFVIQLISGTFLETYDPTLEDSYRKLMTVDGKDIILNIYDTAGQADFSAVRDQYIRIADVLIILFSITQNDTFEEVPVLMEKSSNMLDCDTFPFIIVGTKCDLEEDREVQYATAKKLADQCGVSYLEASGKTKTNIIESFEECVRCYKGNNKGYLHKLY